ncbi:hypothetical protein EVJ58_g3677 [Rhodofomes roseus]|uniref:Serpentine receptor class gamma n=1 Tax=Rhodofomes roseus TaxID=34475 RepID=A0A4Y9YKS6_9APHY|nr:hypothetical protein EVJ58_g3677 [Rhodofomes roseus]
MGAFPIPQAQLAALFMQSIAYGIHAVTFAICMYTWFNQSNNSWTSASRIWLSIAIGLFVIGTCDVAFNFYHNLMAFITAPIGMSPTEVFDQASNWGKCHARKYCLCLFRGKRAMMLILQSVWFYMNAALSDAALIYRCWKVYHDAKPYHRAIVVIVPTILWTVCISFASMIIYYLSTVDASTTIPMIPQLQPFLYSFYVTTVVLNLFTTGLIISKCWERHQDNSGDTYLPTRKRLNFADIIRITVESALLYTTTVVFCVVLDLARTNAYYGITDIVSLSLLLNCTASDAHWHFLICRASRPPAYLST